MIIIIMKRVSSLHDNKKKKRRLKSLHIS